MYTYLIEIFGGKFNDTRRYYSNFKTAHKMAKMYLTKGETKQIGGNIQFADIYQIEKETGKKQLIYSM